MAVLVLGVTYAGCLSGLANINPCGTVLSTDFCDPQQFAQVFGNFWQPNYDIDPTCTVPFVNNECPEIVPQGGEGG